MVIIGSSYLSGRSFPKVLIIGQYFDQQRGGGITLRNLFSGWPRSRIAVAAAFTGACDWETCTNYYRLGSEEAWWPWPLGRLVRAAESGPVAAEGPALAPPTIQEESAPSLLGRIYTRIDRALGLEGGLPRARISNRLLSWASDFSPHVIYAQLPSIQLMSLTADLADELKVPIALHVADDWPATIYGQGLIGGFYRRKAQRMFAHLACRSALRMAICETMAEEYGKRYGGEWQAFHNPVCLEAWPARETSLAGSAERPMEILFAGRIGRALYSCFFDVADAVAALNREGIRCRLVLHLLIADKAFQDRLRDNPCVAIKAPVPHSQMPALLSSADLLLLPLDFDGEWVQFAKLSMPTKAAEWMASGTPVLVYAPEGHALTEYAASAGWAFVVNRRDPKTLQNSIKTLLVDQAIREKLSRRARQVAEMNHGAENVRRRFQSALANTAMKEP